MEGRSHLGIGIALGVAIGSAIGVAMDNLALGIGIGIGVGVALGIALDAGRKRKDGDKEQLLWVVEGLPVPTRILQRKDGNDEMNLTLKSIM